MVPGLRVTVTVATLAMIGCSAGTGGGDAGSQVGKPATISHIHGLGVDSSGSPYIATHHGLITAAADGGWVYASADTNDHMGFSLHAGDGVMYRSGHSQEKPALGVESSTDGARWSHVSDVLDPPVDFHAMAVSFADSKTLWGSDSGGRGAFRSADGGRTWGRIDTSGIEQIFVLAGTVKRNEVYAGTARGLYRSVDGGASWKLVAVPGAGWVLGVASDPKDATHMLVFTEGGMKTTRDAGKTWSDAGRGLPAGAQIGALSISPADAQTAYAANSSTVYKTADGGRTWSEAA